MRLYDDLAAWWPLLDDPADYAEEAGLYGDLLAEACDAPIESLLELGCGGGNGASHLKRRFRRLVLTDLSPGMLAVSRALNPECEHRLGDMRTLRLGRTFDAVFVHDAVCYMTTEDDLRRAMETAWAHCRPGGAVLFAPDYVRENFRPGATAGGCDEESRHSATKTDLCAAPGAAAGGRDERPAPGAVGVGPGPGPRRGLRGAGRGEGASPVAAGECARGLRYLEWVWDPDPRDTEYLVDFAFLLRERDGSVRAVSDRHVEGLFARGRWLELLAGVGFAARRAPLVLSDVEPGRHEMFVGRRPR